MNKRIGVMSSLTKDADNFQTVLEYGLSTCQLVSWDPSLWTEETAEAVVRTKQETGIHVPGFWAGWTGPAVWDFEQGPDALGIVPEKYRKTRVEELKRAGDFAAACGLPAVITHLGFIPENPGDPRFAEVVVAVAEVAGYLEDLELQFWFETGQETPVTMLRLIKESGKAMDRPNGAKMLGINLDPANLILYGKANPIDSLDVFGDYIRNIHVKDGLYPTDPMKLGTEVKVGEGKVRFPEFVRALEGGGFTGEYIIEREISGEQQRQDIADTVKYLEGLL